MNQTKKSIPFAMLFTILPILLLITATGLKAEISEMPEQLSQDKPSVENIMFLPGFPPFFSLMPAIPGMPGIRMPLVSDRHSADEPDPIAITGGKMSFNNNTLIMENLAISISPLILRNIRPEGSEAGPGFGTVYQKNGKHTISGSISIEPLP